MMRLVLAFVLLAAPVFAQEAAAPVLSPEAAARLRVFELTAENLALKMALLQQAIADNQTAANAYAATLAVEGYRLERGQHGWRYEATPKGDK